MSLFSTFSKKAPNRVFISIALGAMAGICYALLIPLVINVLSVTDSRFEPLSRTPDRFWGLEIAHAPVAALFTLVCVFIVVSRTWSQIMLTRVSMDVARDLRVTMYQQIASAPLSAIERIGPPRLIAALTSDVPRIVLGAELLPDVLIHSITLIGMLSYLMYLNIGTFWFVMGCITFGVITYQVPMIFAGRFFTRAGLEIDALQEGIQGLTRGIKELKLNDEKRQAYFEQVLLHHENELRQARKTGNTILRLAMNYGDMLCFFVIGAIAFIFLNYHAISSGELVGVIMTLLYITGPIGNILAVAPQIAIAQTSVLRVQKLMRELPMEDFPAPQRKATDWNTLRFEQICYQHQGADDMAGFGIGPIDLEFKKGEITFIVGGNGSGKSTLCKLITLHYPSASGRILFGDELVDNASINRFRQGISAIYSDYYLFDRVLAADVRQDLIEHYLQLFKLDKKVTYKNGRFSTLALSDGQRRRLALVVAFIEDKDLYLFDEWAADQDPSFKEAFYHEILPSLRERGKVVVAITHDDRYFDTADKVVIMADGKVSRIETNCHR